MDGDKPLEYCCPLPTSCISLNSPEGKRLFREAMNAGHMECFFKMSSQFRTQDEPAYCGLSTLVMVLNALEIDPGKVWKHPWRWYHENMLECCVPLDVVKKCGTTFDQLICLATCNHMEVSSVTRVNETACFERFRSVVKECSVRDDAFLVLCFSRVVLGQRGDGHVSPMGGYHPDKDLILIMDTARFKYPPYWIPLSFFWESFKALDSVTSKPRGYLVVSKPDQTSIFSPLLGLPTSLSITESCRCFDDIASVIIQLYKRLEDDVPVLLSESVNPLMSSDNSERTSLALIIRHLICSNDIAFNIADYLNKYVHRKQDLVHNEENYKNDIKLVLRHIEDLELFKIIRNCLVFEQCHCISVLGKSVLQNGKQNSVTITCAHVVTVVLLSLPHNKKEGRVGGYLGSYVKQVFKVTDMNLLRKEVSTVKKHFIALLEIYVI